MTTVNERTVETKTTDRTGEILTLLRNPQVDFNRQSEKYWGCIFIPQEDGRFTVIAPSAYYAAIIRNVVASPKEQFFSFFDNCWQKDSSFPLSAEKILGAEESERKKRTGACFLHPATVINWLGQFEKPILQKSRIIVSPGELGKRDIALAFHQEGADKVSYIKNVGKFVVSKDSAIPQEFIKPGQTYKCQVLQKEGDDIIVNVLEVYGRVRFGLKFSPNCFDPADMQHHIRLEGLVSKDTAKFGIFPHNSIIATNAIESQIKNWFPIPTHIDASMFATLTRLFVLQNSSLIGIEFGDNPNSPIIMRSVTGPNELNISIVLATLNPDFGMQVR